MAAIPTILKGDTPAAIPISLAEGFDYAEATLHVRYMGVEKVFTGLVAGGSLSLQFTEEETSSFPVGAAQVGMWLVYPGGRIRTIPTDNVRIKVTDSASEVYNAQITLHQSTLPPDATDADTLGDLKAKYNALKATIAAGCAALCVLVSSAAGISGGNLNDIPGNAMVVTNVTFDGLATLSDLKYAGVSPETVTNIVKAVAPKPDDYTTTNAVKDIVTNEIGVVPLVEDSDRLKTAVTIGSRNYDRVGAGSLANGNMVSASGKYSHAEGAGTAAFGDYSHADGGGSHADADYSHAGGFMAWTRAGDDYAFAWSGDDTDGTYASNGKGTFNINPKGGLNGFYIGEKNLSQIISNGVANIVSAENQTFSNAVLAVGLNIDTNSVAVLNEIAETFGGFPIEGTATTVGGLLAALAAAVAWLKKNKVGSFASVGGASATVENGVAKLDEFFTESNSLLTSRVNTLIDAKVNNVNAVLAAALDGTEVA